MNLETGTPKFEGRYLVYVEGVMGWLEPHIVVWTGAKWKFLNSTQDYPDEIFGWLGPLPVVSKSSFEAKPEYDL